MAVALIAALGTIVVALIGFLVQRTQANDARTRLQKDIDLLGKLDPLSLEHKWMANHVQRTVYLLTYTERSPKRLPSSFLYWSLLIAGRVLPVLYLF